MTSTSTSSTSTTGTHALTLEEHVRTRLAGVPEHDGLERVIAAIAAGALAVAQRTRLAALSGALGSTGEINVQGEIVQRLDALGTEIFVNGLSDCGGVAALACEELEEMVHVSDAADHPFLAVFDPVDGSSNIDVAVTIGSIFGIYRRPDQAPVTSASLLRPGREQVAAVYAIYGSSTMLVVATRNGVDGYTVHPETGTFLLTHPDIRIPSKCSCYSVNEHNQDRWEPGMQRAVAVLREQYSLRYIGSLVADFHRNLLKGGIFLYPGDQEVPAGKLRLSYEAAPLAFVVEQAGGAAGDSRRRILDLVPEQLHQRTPLVIGNADVVQDVDRLIAVADAAQG